MTAQTIPAETLVTKPVPVALLPDDTCDRCGPATRATVAVMLRAGKLTFCKHHYSRFEASLAPLVLGVTP
jgi:ArsR family metal-binding transcriptional regulator